MSNKNHKLRLDLPITVKDLAKATKIKPAKLIDCLHKNGFFVELISLLCKEDVRLVARYCSFKVEEVGAEYFLTKKTAPPSLKETAKKSRKKTGASEISLSERNRRKNDLSSRRLNRKRKVKPTNPSTNTGSTHNPRFPKARNLFFNQRPVKRRKSGGLPGRKTPVLMIVTLEKYRKLLEFVLVTVFQRRYQDLTDRRCEKFVEQSLPLHEEFRAFHRERRKEQVADVVKQFLVQTFPELWKDQVLRIPENTLEKNAELRTYFENRRAAARASNPVSGAFTQGVDECDLFINVGVDFGTSSVKAVYRIYDDETSYPVRFSPPHENMNYVLPDSLWIFDDALFFADHGDGTHIPSLKRSLSAACGGELQRLEESETRDRALARLADVVPELRERPSYELYEFLTAIYLTFVLYRIKTFIVADLRRRRERCSPGFSAYMCVPVSYFSDSTPTLLANRAALGAADRLFGCLPNGQLKIGKVPVRDAWQAWQRVIRSASVYDFGPEAPTQVYPEVTAEAASYWHSKAARPGRYILVDIGAGTCDVNVFTVVDELGDQARKSPVLWAEISALGVEELEHRLCQALPALERDTVMAKLQLQKWTAAGRESAGVFPSFTGDLAAYSNCEEIVEEYRTELAQRLWLAYGKAQEKGGLESWKNATIFIGGGGRNLRNIKSVKDIFDDHPVLKDITVRELPEPNDFECAGPEIPFHRLSVAYGLSLMLERQALPFEIPDQRQRRRPRINMAERFISKDQV
jgi:hypothetical protein